MDSIQTTSNNDDQELAQALAGLDNSEPVSTDLSFEKSPANDGPVSPFSATPTSDSSSDTPPPSPAASPVSSDDQQLDSIKKDALNELRPLVDKLTVPPQEKFDTYLLLLRSTDDKTLIAPAHEAAKVITDEAHRAQALLDVIKEIDFLTAKK
ncbi:MAG: hypothetical protein WAS27_01250 [Candidatus Saccharimonadales bacterium]